MPRTRQPCPIAKWQAVLVHELTRYDMRESARERARRFGRENIYRLSHLLKGAQDIEDQMQDCRGTDAEASEACLEKMKTLVETRFLAGDQAISPIRRFLRQLEKRDCKLRP